VLWLCGARFLARDTERAPLRLAAAPRGKTVAKLPRAG
jgi:hypothetical protein